MRMRVETPELFAFRKSLRLSKPTLFEMDCFYSKKLLLVESCNKSSSSSPGLSTSCSTTSGYESTFTDSHCIVSEDTNLLESNGDSKKPKPDTTNNTGKSIDKKP